MEKSAKRSLLERRPSYTEAELTPIVLNELQNARKHKEEWKRAARRGSHQKSESDQQQTNQPAASTVRSQGAGNTSAGELVSDSGAESCGEETRKRTAAAFMSGIQTALTGNLDQELVEKGSEDIVSEVNNVLGKLMASLQKGDTVGPVSGNIIPLITSLQATLLGQQHQQQQQQQPPLCNSRETDGQGSKSIAGNEKDSNTQGSKIPWKIRAGRKRQQKHLTLGLTREEFAHIQETLRNRPVEFGGIQPAPYSLMRNKSEGQILRTDRLRGGAPGIGEGDKPGHQQDGAEVEEEDLQGYVSDVCDYNVRQEKSGGGDPVLVRRPDHSNCDRVSAQNNVEDGGTEDGDKSSLAVIHGKLSLGRQHHEEVAERRMTGSSNPPVGVVTGGGLNATTSRSVGRIEDYCGSRAGRGQLTGPAGQSDDRCTDEDVDATNNNDNDESFVQTAVLHIKPGVGNVGRQHHATKHQSKNNNNNSINHSTLGNSSSRLSEEDTDSHMSRQSSVEDTKSDVGGGEKNRRRSSGGKSSAIKSRIQMRRMMKEANRLDIPVGSLSDQETGADPTDEIDNDRESVEEKQDSESVQDDEIRNSSKKRLGQGGGGTGGKLGSHLTPETARRMKDWNSRFSNLKSSFDATTSDREEDTNSNWSPSMHRHLMELSEVAGEERGRSRELVELSAAGGGGESRGRSRRHQVELSEGEDRGRSRIKEKTNQKRAQSAHGSLRSTVTSGTTPSAVTATAGGRGAGHQSLTAGGRGAGHHSLTAGDQSVSTERPQSKDDKNKNNTLIAKTGARLFSDSATPKDKSPFLKRFEDTDDEYLQYLNFVDRYRQNHPNPKPFRPVTARTDAIANPVRKLSEGQQPMTNRQQSLKNSQTHLQGAGRSKQTTPVSESTTLGKEGMARDSLSGAREHNSYRENILANRISKSVPKEVTRTRGSFREESQAEILGLVRTNKETGQVEKTNDMDYEDYMNIINRVRKTKEFTRVRTEQARLASMYAQEKKRQEEIQLEEERLRLEREKFEEERKLQLSNHQHQQHQQQQQQHQQQQQQQLHQQQQPQHFQSGNQQGRLSGRRARSDENIEKGQLDNREQEQSVKAKQQPKSEENPSDRESQEQLGDREEKPGEKVGEHHGEQDNGHTEWREAEQEREQEERKRLEELREEQTRQQRLREEQVLAEQKKLEKLREEQVKQEREREEIRRLEIERLRQIQEDQERLEEERRRQEMEIRLEQGRLEEEKRKQEKLQRERQEQYQKQEEEMIAKAKAMEAQKALQVERLKLEQIRQTSMSPHERLIQEKLRQQERIREDQLKEEAQIRQEKLNLIRQEETLLLRQEEMLRQIQDEKVKLMKQEDMIRSRQQERLKQVRAEKALLEKQEHMLKLREEQLLQERQRQEKLREEASCLKRQEEEIRRRQEEIQKELMQADMSLTSVDEVLVCQARQGQVFRGRQPHYPETVLDGSIVHVQQLSASDWSSSDAESMIPSSSNRDTGVGSMQNTIGTINNSYKGANDNYDDSPFIMVEQQTSENLGDTLNMEETFSGSSEDEDTMEEDCYECKVEVKQQNTQVPTSVRTIETVIDVPGWAPVTPYLNVSKHLPTTSHEEMSAIFSESRMQFKTAGIVTSPDSIITSTNVQTTPESSISLQSQLSMAEDHSIDSSSCPASPLPPVPPHPKESKDLMVEHFQTVQPDVPPRDDSFAITAVYCTVGPTAVSDSIVMQTNTQRKSLIEMDYIPIPSSGYQDPQLSPRLGGPGSAFRPYASSENLFDPATIASIKAPTVTNGHQSEKSKRHSTSSLKPPKVSESDEDFFKPRIPKHLRAPIMSTTDTEPEMKEFNLAPIGSDKKGKKHQKIFYSTSETEEEYQAYLKSKPKWHGKGGHKDSWDPLQIASPPQIVQRPVGIVQKPKPQSKPVPIAKVERGAEAYPVSFNIYPDSDPSEAPIYTKRILTSQENNNSLAPPNFERIQKSDSIIELRKTSNLAGERIQKSTSVIEVIPADKVQIVSPRNMMDIKDMKQQTLQDKSSNNVEINNCESLKPTYTSQPTQDLLKVPSFSSPPDSEDQTTPQAPRKMFLQNQTSFDSSNSFSENEEGHENLAPQLKNNREDPETKKKKEIHKNLMSEALKKVELRNNQKKNFSQLSRTNPTIAALGIVTRKELKMEEMENKQEQEYLRNRNRSGSNNNQEENIIASGKVENTSGVNSNVLQSFRMQSIHKGSLNNAQHSSSREAEIQARKAGRDVVKSDISLKTNDSQPISRGVTIDSDPVVVLKKTPRILDQEELNARQSTTDLGKPDVTGENSMSSNAASRIKSPVNNKDALEIKDKKNELEVKKKTSENIQGPNPEKDVTHLQNNSPNNQSELGKKTGNKRNASDIEHDVAKANENISAAKQRINNNEGKPNIPAKQILQGIIQVKPRTESPHSGSNIEKKLDLKKVVDDDLSKGSGNEENIVKGASVKKAAERFESNLSEANNFQSDSFPSINLNSPLKSRSKSIGNAIREQLKENCSNNNNKTVLPWTGKSPPVLRKKEGLKNKGYALQMSKSSDSITAAKLLAKARAENMSKDGGLRINKNFSKSIEQQIDIYSKTKEEIRMILMLAKSGSVNDRIALFSNLTPEEKDPNTPESKAEKIRKEIETAKAQTSETISDTEIEFVDPIESKVKPLKIPMKPKLLGKDTDGTKSSLRINQQSNLSSSSFRERRASIEDLPSVKSKIQTYLSAADDETNPKSILVNKNKQFDVKVSSARNSKERSKSPRKKTPKPVGDQYLSPNNQFQIYTQSATDMSATEDEQEEKGHHVSRSRVSAFKHRGDGDAGPTLLQVPAKPVQDVCPGIVKSKSFASPGQFESYLDEDVITSKKQTMMAFFGHGAKRLNTEVRPRRSSVSSITDEILGEGDDELVDIDAEFESLLNSTFEKESKKLLNASTSQGQTTDELEKAQMQRGDRKGGDLGSGRGKSTTGQSSLYRDRGGKHSSSNDPQLLGRLQKSKSFSAAPVTFSQKEVGQTSEVHQRHHEQVMVGQSQSAMYQNSSNTIGLLRQKGFDPISALPTSSGRQNKVRSGAVGTPPFPNNSPSPTQSEYDTCDPWDEY